MKKKSKSVSKANKKLSVSIVTFGFVFLGAILIVGGNITNLMGNSVTTNKYYCEEKGYVLKDNKCYGDFKYDAMILGDVNNSGDVDNKDVSTLASFINKEEGYVFDDFRFSASDLNKDGNVDNNDLKILQDYLNKSNTSTSIGLSYVCPADYKLNDTSCEKSDVVDAKKNDGTGDINNDNRVDNKDIVLLANYLNDNQKLSDKEKKAADLNNDNNIDTLDLELLRNILNSQNNQN